MYSPIINFSDRDNDTIPEIFIAAKTSISVDLHNYITDPDGFEFNFALQDDSELPLGLTYDSGIIQGTAEHSGSIVVRIDNGFFSYVLALEIKAIDILNLKAAETELQVIAGNTDESFAITSDQPRILFTLDLDEGESRFSQITINPNGSGSFDNYLLDGNYSDGPERSGEVTFSDAIGNDGIVDTIISHWSTEVFTLSDAKAVNSINGVDTTGLYQVTLTTTVTAPNTYDSPTAEWWENGYEVWDNTIDNGDGTTGASRPIESLTEFATTLVESSWATVWTDSSNYEEVRLLDNGDVVAMLEDGSIGSWVDEFGVVHYYPQRFQSDQVIGSWNKSDFQSSGYLVVTLDDGAVTAYKMDSTYGLMETSFPNPGFTETDTLYYGDNLTAQTFGALVDRITDESEIDYTLPLTSDAYVWSTHQILESVYTQRDGSLFKPLEEEDTGRVISAADALAALKLAVGLNPNPDSVDVSPYQYFAADVNQDGRVSAADALSILKMAVNLNGAPEREWLFFNENEDFWDETSSQFTIGRSSVDWNSLNLEHTGNQVAVLKGDVNGSWSNDALPQLPQSHFDDLVASGIGPAEQWWLV